MSICVKWLQQNSKNITFKGVVFWKLELFKQKVAVALTLILHTRNSSLMDYEPIMCEF